MSRPDTMNGMILLHVLSYLKIQILNGKNI